MSFFSLAIAQDYSQTTIAMQLFTYVVNTKSIPKTYTILLKTLPSILASQCFNKEQKPFYKEVRRTEIGHLFEHILLEHLCIAKLASGADKASYSGITNWNWEENQVGSFTIRINVTSKDRDIFALALTKSKKLLNQILLSSPKYYSLATASKIVYNSTHENKYSPHLFS